MIYSGEVVDVEIFESLSNVKIVAYKNNKIVEETSSCKNGKWTLLKESTDRVKFYKEGYWDKDIEVNLLEDTVALLSKNIIGYHDKLYFLPGEEIECKVNSGFPYAARLFRFGLNKKLILKIENLNSQRQEISDDFDLVSEGLDWCTSFSYRVPDDASPGLFGMQLENSSGERFTIPMVVSTRDSDYGKNSKVLVLASNTTWQSYNTWGGRSRYRNFRDSKSRDFISEDTKIKNINFQIKKLIPVSIKKFLKKILKKDNNDESWMFKKLTTKRPFINCSLEDDNVCSPFSNHLAAAEWRVLAWLEREGVEYDFISGFELHENGDLLSNYQQIILSSHCEYWSKGMFESLKYYHVKNKLSILNISGNSIYREIEFDDFGQTRCISLSFKKSHVDESTIVGVRYTGTDYGTAASYKVINSNHWVFNGTMISDDNLMFGQLSLNQNLLRTKKRYDPGRVGKEKGLNGVGASGWETDKLTKHSPKNCELIAKGGNAKGGADMIVKDFHNNTGFLFSASSILFGGSLLIDDVSSTVVKNVITYVYKNNGKSAI